MAFPQLRFKLVGKFKERIDSRSDASTSKAFQNLSYRFNIAGGEVDFVINPDRPNLLTPSLDQYYSIEGFLGTLSSGRFDLDVDSITPIDVDNVDEFCQWYGGYFSGPARLTKNSYEKDGEFRFFLEYVSGGFLYNQRLDNLETFQKCPEGIFDVEGKIYVTSRVNANTKRRSTDYRLELTNAHTHRPGSPSDAPRVRPRRDAE